ncbi:MAG TPA: hypothetical protein VF247_04785 [Candidatus Krumholzibacteria bacterium]
MRTSARLVALVVLLFAGRSARAADAESLLLPGIDMRSIQFTVGAWCRYRVIDEAMGTSDTSTVYLAVVGREKTAKGAAYWLEVESTPPGGAKSDRDVARALVDERIQTMGPGDSLHTFITRYYTRKGDGPVEEGDPRQLRRLSMASPASPSDWKNAPNQSVKTPAGTFVCERRSFAATESRDIPSGRVTLKQKRSDRVEVFTSPSVPLFHLVKSEVERTRESHTVPPVRGIPDAGPRTSRTTSLLVAHGTGAKALIRVH